MLGSTYNATYMTIDFTYDDANRLTTVGGQTYSFDANGNLLSDGTFTYTYDTANRLVGVATAATAVTYRYNGDGNRLQQSSNGVDTNYTLELNSGLSQVLADGTSTYLYGMSRLGMSNTTGNSILCLYARSVPRSDGHHHPRTLTSIIGQPRMGWSHSGEKNRPG